jgi:hypothetical protein
VGKGSKIIVISGMWAGKWGVIIDLTKDGNLLVALVDDQGDLGRWILKPFEVEDLRSSYEW